ncbi:MAG: class I SAM-dependent methyltransferase [Bacteroidota bacterium]
MLFAEENALLPLLDALPLNSSTVADFGCGTGRHFRDLLDRGARNVVGVDYSLPMLLHARDKSLNTNVTLFQSGLEHLPFCNESFHFGLSALVLGHLGDIDASIKEFHRVLKPGGRLILTDLHESFEERGWKRTFTEGGKKFAVRNYPHSMGEYQNAFRSHNFVVEKASQPTIDDTLRPLFERTGHIETFERFRDRPLLIVFQVRKKG